MWNFVRLIATCEEYIAVFRDNFFPDETLKIWLEVWQMTLNYTLTIFEKPTPSNSLVPISASVPINAYFTILFEGIGKHRLQLVSIILIPKKVYRISIYFSVRYIHVKRCSIDHHNMRMYIIFLENCRDNFFSNVTLTFWINV